ncbi:unnamed protein product [Prunus armeniaca]|uniref:Uncharacterized protein n=1 Tax=Prunus armeniaca TaxID=36596 RepID=A0A6J5XB57_PRUAR|nr:unnamed protein product [Prunus armeniaca]CAB4310121.1 unnamed protein product [Prunus armeniaca]
MLHEQPKQEEEPTLNRPRRNEEVPPRQHEKANQKNPNQGIVGRKKEVAPGSMRKPTRKNPRMMANRKESECRKQAGM